MFVVSATDLFYFTFAIGAGWGLANLSKELIVTVINQVAAAVIMRKQIKNMRSGYSTISGGDQ